MRKFSVSFCDAIEPEMIPWGYMAPDTIMDHFEKIDWNAYFQKSMAARMDDIYFDPSLEVVHKEGKNGLVISAFGALNQYKFNITYRRPKKEKKFFGLLNKVTENYSTAVQVPSMADAMDCLKAYLNQDTAYLANKGF